MRLPEKNVEVKDYEQRKREIRESLNERDIDVSYLDYMPEHLEQQQRESFIRKMGKK